MTDYDEDIAESVRKNCTLINLSLGGNKIDEKLLEVINMELSNNKSISDFILPMITDEEKTFKGHKLSLAGKGISNLDFLAKFIRENPQVTGVNVEMDDFQRDEVQKVAEALKGNTSESTLLYVL